MNLNRISLWALLGAALLAGGCQRTQLTSPLNTNHAADDANAELEFWHQLADRPLTTNDEAIHGLIIFANGSDPTPDYPARVAWMKEHGHLSQRFDEPGDMAVQFGIVAQMLASILKIEGGLTMRLLGNHPRYAAQELVYQRIMPYRTAQQGVTGIEFVGILSKAEAFQEGKL